MKDIKEYANQWPDERLARVRALTWEVLSRGVWGPGWWHVEAFLFSNLEALQTFLVFMEAALQRHYWSNHQPLAPVDSISSSLPQPGNQGVELKVPSLFPRLVFLDNQPPSLGTFQNRIMNKPRCAGMGFIVRYRDTHFTFVALSNVRIWGQRTIL